MWLKCARVLAIVKSHNGGLLADFYGMKPTKDEKVWKVSTLCALWYRILCSVSAVLVAMRYQNLKFANSESTVVARQGRINSATLAGIST